MEATTESLWDQVTEASPLGSAEEVIYWEKEYYYILFRYLGPVLILVGSVGNLISICVMNTGSFRGTSHAILLALLAFVDLGVLYTGLLRQVILKSTPSEYDIRAFSVHACKAHFFLTYLFQNLSSWTLVLVTLDRLVSLWLPFRVKVICSVNRIIIAWVAMAVFMILANMHWLIFTDVHYDQRWNYTKCSYSPEHQFLFQFGTWLDFCLLHLIPLAIILPSNLLIMYKVYKMRKRRRTDLGVQQEGSTRVFTSINVMLLVVTFVFVLTTAPITIYFIGSQRKLWPTSLHAKDKFAKTYFAFAVCNMLYYLNSAVNFFLYCLSGSHFRQALKMCSLSLINSKSRRRRFSRRSHELRQSRLHTIQTSLQSSTRRPNQQQSRIPSHSHIGVKQGAAV